MVGVDTGIGIMIVVAGAVLFVVEILHPGALLIIPATIMLVAGFLYLFIPTVLLNSVVGPFAVMVAAVLASIATVLYYRWLAGTHKPIATTPSGLVGEEALVVADVVPDTLRGKVRVRSEIWSARAPNRIPAGTRVRIVHGEGVSVTVEPVETTPPASSP